MNDIITKNRQTIEQLCQTNSVRTLYVFGSVLDDRFTPISDIDMVVDIDSDDPIRYADQYFTLKFDLETLFDRKVDLLEQSALKNRYFLENINQTKQKIYG